MKYVSLFILLFPCSVFAQLDIPAASPPAHLTQKVGYTTFQLDYHRPNVKGRKIFGELIPYGQVWRSGANEASLLRFDRPIQIGDTEITAGSYSFYAIPDEKQWTLILNSDTTLWGARGFDSTKNVVEWSTPPISLSQRVETLEFRWMNVSPQSVDLVLEWEYLRVVLPIRVSTDQQLKQHIAQHLHSSSSGSDYYKAARYYLDNGLDLRQAQKWMNQRVALDGNQFGILRYKALIEKALGQDEAAQATMALSLQLAQEKNNEHYVRMNQQSLRNWSREPVSISGAELLEKSIQYHDPSGQWWQDSLLEFPLYEERPDGKYRITQLEMIPARGVFRMSQRRGPDVIDRSLNNGVCIHALNKRQDLSADEKKAHRLDCDFTQVMQNYYAYLWGMPMKLRDEGTQIESKVFLRNFYGKDLLEMKVTYDPDVGSDVWYFYFDPSTYALSGYRFYHDEEQNDGEYILLSGEEKVNNMRIPKRREWYTHKDRLYLGYDLLLPRVITP